MKKAFQLTTQIALSFVAYLLSTSVDAYASYAGKFDSFGNGLFKMISELIRGPYGWIAFALMCLVGIYEYFFGKRDAMTLVITVIGIIILCIIGTALHSCNPLPVSSAPTPPG